MNRKFSLLPLGLIVALTGAQAWAANESQDPHHPTATVSPPTAKKPMSGKSDAAMARMDEQMKSMKAMHDKMMAAKTPEERDALKVDQMKAMQDGMAMMNGVPSDGAAGKKGDMTAHHQMMEKRMEMMQAMMQMMMDRLPTVPAN